MVRMHRTGGETCPGSGKPPGLRLWVDLGDAGYMCLEYDGDVFDLDDADRAFMFGLLAKMSARRAVGPETS